MLFLNLTKFKTIFAPFIVIVLLVYFIYHIFQGERGVRAWIRINQKLKENEAILNHLQAEKRALEAQVHLLRPDSLDKDLLEEKVRQVLNFAHPDDVIITISPEK